MLHTSYTWNNSYVLPYESEWSICSKFCYLNGLNIREYKHYKNKIYKPPTTYNIAMLRDIYFSRSLHKYVHVCPKCIKYGYHSVFHQSSLFSHCFIHKHKKLQETKYPYGLTDYYNNRINFYTINTDITIENIVKNKVLLNEINNISTNIKLNDTKTYHLLDFADNITTLYYDEEIRRFLLHKIFGYKNYSQILEIFRIKKEDIFKTSSDILKAIKFDVYHGYEIGFHLENNGLCTT